MDEAPLPGGADPGLIRYLRRLVTLLTLTMIGGFLVLIAVLVIRLGPAPGPVLPESLVLPEGTRALAVTHGEGWLAVVTDTDLILIYDAGTGALRQTVRVEQ